MFKDNTIMEMETDRIILRRWQEEDADALYRYASDAEVGPRAGWPPHQSIESSRSIIRNLFTNGRTWAGVWDATHDGLGSSGYRLATDSDRPGGGVLRYGRQSARQRPVRRQYQARKSTETINK